MELQMALSRRLLGHIHGNFTHMTTMTYIFMLTCQSTLLTWIFVFVLRPRSAREMGRMAMINVSLGSQSTRNFIWDEIFWLLTCQETKIHVDFMKSSWILWFRRSSHYVWCEVSLDAEFPQDFEYWHCWRVFLQNPRVSRDIQLDSMFPTMLMTCWRLLSSNSIYVPFFV